MLFKSKENQCLLQVLEILNKRVTTYGKLFKETKVSHTTLQRVLNYLVERKFVEKSEEGYKITNKGKEPLQLLQQLKILLK